MFYSLEGRWQADLGDRQIYDMNLPGTLDENGIGGIDRDGNWNGGQVIRSRFTRKYTFEGETKLTRRVSFDVPRGKRVFLEAERARVLKLLLDGREIPDFREPSLSTPHVFELTDAWKGSHEIALLSDNSYPGLPRRDIMDSSAATDETQTNWNGVLGYLRLRVEEPVFVEAVKVYSAGNGLTVKVSVCGNGSWNGKLTVSSEAAETASAEVSGEAGTMEYTLEKLALAENAVRWDEYEGNLYSLKVRLEGHVRADNFCSEKEITFGIRDFGSNANGRLALNGRTIFLRCEANCAVFPETGYCPMTVEEWMDILGTYKSYGVNCMRFHSHCPPEAAFTAADRMGMLMEPELSHWNAVNAFETEESYRYYRTELVEILRMLANHPSFVMLTFGNELHASEKGHARMKALLEIAHALDATRLYANGSNVHYGDRGCDENSDFYTATRYHEWQLRGTSAGMTGYLNHQYPNAMTDYDESLEKLREKYKKPVFSFEVGQFEVLPDFGELAEFRGVTEPANLRWVQSQMKGKGLEAIWNKYVEATGELSRICYREEIEAAMRTEGMSGISLLGLQDFPGQGTALVGMLNSHLQPKPYAFAQPERFRVFFSRRLPLVLLEKYTYESTETLKAAVKVANFGKGILEGELRYKLQGQDFCVEGMGERVSCPEGKLTGVGRLAISLAAVTKPERLELTVSVGTAVNNYPVWVYPPVKPVCPESVYETTELDEKAYRVLAAGKKVYLTPPSDKEALPVSVQAQFSTDFWSVGTFSSQEGAMGQLIDAEHPVFRDFPTEFHTNWQWWPMASARAVILPKPYKTIVAEMDSYAFLRPMAQLLECRCGNGKLLFSSMGLQDLQKYPEARALLGSIYRYMDSEEFAPEQEIEWDVWKALMR